MSNYILENEQYHIEISDMGAELISVKKKEDGREYIWQADPAVWKRHAPVLFPLVGRYREDTSIHQGKEYHMTQHGFARDMQFEVVREAEKELVFRLTSTPETKERYPFDFELSCGYRLEGNCLSVSWEVRGGGNQAIYFSIGGHPAFVGSTNTLSNAQLHFETDEDFIDFNLLNENGLYVETKYALPLDDGKRVALSEDFFDKDALIVENSQCSKVSLFQDGERIASVTFDAPVFGLWSAAHQKVPFVCIEPWYGRTDAADFEGELKDREWANTLQPGDVFQASYEICFGPEQ